ncbi:Zinc finger transcription factor family protein 17 [Holothuria leucospilota]|uniref:Zinc finger transcription factor family protein 17 n=1 Tax=Holothuria leucospilota TaxID=206669 RepID=A0A9Q1B9I6_HOLLE|nr:Zinc finger transcription factor family protein 17 [Holothuria leucospilota]
MDTAIRRKECSPLLRRNEYPQKQQKEEEWFSSCNAPSEVVDPQPMSSSTQEAFKDVIWNKSTHEIISSYGMTPDEMARLCGEGENGWFLSSHMVHLLHKMTQSQRHTLCFCLNATNASTRMAQLQKDNPGFKDIHQLVFIINVGKQGDNTVYIGSDDHPGKHWTLAVVTLSSWDVVYCDSMAWGVPDDILPRLEEYTSYFDVRLSMSSFKVCHIPTPSGQNHICQSGCTNYPLQTCSNVCGVVALVCAAIATFDLSLFDFLCKPQSTEDFYLRNPTAYNKYLRCVLISWFMTGKIDIHNVSLKEIPVSGSEEPMIVDTYAQEVEVTLDRKRKRTTDEEEELNSEAVSEQADGSPPIKCCTQESVGLRNDDDHVRSEVHSQLTGTNTGNFPVSDEKDANKSVTSDEEPRNNSDGHVTGEVTVQPTGTDTGRTLVTDKTDTKKSVTTRRRASAASQIPKGRQLLRVKVPSKVGPTKKSHGHATGGVVVQATDTDNGKTLVSDKTAPKKTAATGKLAASPLQFPQPGQLFLLKLTPTAGLRNVSAADHVRGVAPIQLTGTNTRNTHGSDKKDGKKSSATVGRRRSKRGDDNVRGVVPIQMTGTNTRSTHVSDKKDGNKSSGTVVGPEKNSDGHVTSGVTVQAINTDTEKTLVPNETDAKKTETTEGLAASQVQFPQPGQLLVIKLAPTGSDKVRSSSFLYDCPFCDDRLSSRQSRLQHIKVMHPNEKIQKRIRHRRHKVLEPGQVPSIYVCPYCQAEMASRQSLFRHKQKIHPDEKKEEPVRGGIVCSKCKDFHCRKMKELISHLNSAHGGNHQIQRAEFVSEEEFQEWKTNLERTHDTWFVKVSGGNSYHDHKVQYYYCNRSGGSRGLQEREPRRRALKSQGSSKMKEKCCAFLSCTTFKSTGRVVAEYCIDHTHETQIAHLKMSDELRSFVVEKLTSGIEVTAILNEIRDNMSKLDGRDKLVTRRDILNIKRQYNISSTKRDENDSDCAEIGANNLQSQEYDPVVIFTSQGVEQFLLGIQTEFQRDIMVKFGPSAICIASTHKTAQCDFYVTTIAVVDNYGEAIPVAWLVSDRQDESVLIPFMEALKNRVGNIKCDVFMSDLTSSFHNSWCCVFQSPVHRLFCKKHVKKDWNKNVLSRIAGKKLQKDVSAMLDVILCELDELEFRKLLISFLEELETVAPEFRRYFCDSYVLDDKIKLWAACFRKGTIVHTGNMYLEALNRDLKDVDLKQSESGQVSEMLEVFLKKAKDKAHEHYIKHEKGKVTRKVTETRKGHKPGVELVGSIEVVGDGEVWSVAQSSPEDPLYIVKKTKDSCNCKLKCNLCSVCIHMFTCSCTDYTLHSVACKHVHSVKMYCDERGTGSLSSDDETTEAVEYISNSPDNYFSRKVQKSGVELDLNDVKKAAFDEIAKLSRLVEISKDATAVHSSMKYIKAAIATVKGLALQAELVISDEGYEQRDFARKQERKKDVNK